MLAGKPPIFGSDFRSGAGGSTDSAIPAVIIIDKDGVRIEPVKGGTASVLEKVGEVVVKVVERRGEKKKEA